MDVITSDDDGDEPITPEQFQEMLNRSLPGATFEASTFGRGQIDVTAFYNDRMPSSTNGRFGNYSGDDGESPFLRMSSPPTAKEAREHKTWQDKVRANLYRREEILKGGIIPALKELARAKVYDYIFGWILKDPKNPNVLGAYPASREEDGRLFV